MRTNKRLHAKVYIFPDCAIVGSANPSANGLALEHTEATSWHEVCTVISDKGDLKELRQWFDRLYRSTESQH
jgi:phosphatidylserine/phosphatidylglycerophosphate/cardiolipin synthase-like enzyme